MTQTKSSVLLLLTAMMPINSYSQSNAETSIDEPRDYVLWNSAVVEAAADHLEETLGDSALVWETKRGIAITPKM